MIEQTTTKLDNIGVNPPKLQSQSRPPRLPPLQKGRLPDIPASPVPLLPTLQQHTIGLPAAGSDKTSKWSIPKAIDSKPQVVLTTAKPLEHIRSSNSTRFEDVQYDTASVQLPSATPCSSRQTLVDAQARNIKKSLQGTQVSISTSCTRRPQVRDVTKVVTQTTKQIKCRQKTTEVPWKKERDILRKHRQQQNERVKIDGARKPMKATQTFCSSDKNAKPKKENSTASKCMKSERKSVNLSVRRKDNDEDDWNWDKDIEEYLQLETIENNKAQSTSGFSKKTNISGNGSHGHRAHSPGLINSTKGMGFKSKRRIEEEKRVEEERKEKERKEKERIEMMIPQKIRKDLKKYGFR